MGCNCSTSSNTYTARRYMRVDGLIFDKKYVSSLNFDKDTLIIFRKGNCHAFKYKMYGEKSTAQIAAYLIELNTCGDSQVDLTTDDHSLLQNLDVESQHPIKAVSNLQETLDLKQPIIVEVETLPDAVDNKFKILFYNGNLVFSNGESWKKILTEDL